MKLLSLAEQVYLRRRLSAVQHITLDPNRVGVVRIHLVPARRSQYQTPFVVILNGQDILPLQTSWAIMLSCFMNVLQPFEGKEIQEEQWNGIIAQAVKDTQKVYCHTDHEQIEYDLRLLLDCFKAVAAGKKPPISVQSISLGDYAPHMLAPHRMDLMVSSMKKDGIWHCNQKCLHCYAAEQPLGMARELDTDQWLAVIQKCRMAGIPQLTFTGGEPTMRSDLVQLVEASQWFVTRLNTNGRLLTADLCQQLYKASLDAVQITFYSHDAEIHNRLVGVAGYADTVNGIKNALAAGLNVSLNTPLCSLNKDYQSTVEFAHKLGVRYLSCSGLIPAGNAAGEASRTTRLSPEELAQTLREAFAYAAENGMEMQFTSPGWLPDEVLTEIGFTQIPSCGACLSNMAVAPDGTVLPCQSWLSGNGLGNILHTPWHRIWKNAECRRIRTESAAMKHLCQLGTTPMGGDC